MEQAYYQANGVIVTATLATFGQTSFPLRGITAVSTNRVPAAYAPGLLAILIAIPFGACTLGGVGATEIRWLGPLLTAVFLITGIASLAMAKTRHTLVLATAGQQVQAYQSVNANEITAIASAITAAISNLR